MSQEAERIQVIQPIPKTYTLKRDGEPDLRLEGELLGEASNHTVRGDRQNRWHEVTVYRTKAGKYVAAIDYVTQWQGETGSHTVTVADSARELLELLAGEGDVVDLAKEALEKAGIEAAETIE